MKHYTKRTIALCLASLVTVVGAFGAENYQNNLMSLKINNGSGGYVSMTAYTEKPYNLPIKIMRNDANTYILVFPGTGCEAKLPKLSNYENIESIGISTFPYTYEREGYTQITIKTIGAPNLKASTMLFIPEKKSDINESKVIEDKKVNEQKSSYWDSHEVSETSSEESREVNNARNITTSKTQIDKTVEDNNTNKAPTETANNTAPQYNPEDYNNLGSVSEHTTAIICVFVLILLIGFIMMVGKDKMAGVVGDNNEFDLEDQEDKKNKKTSKTKKIRKTINKLDKTYQASRHKESNIVRNTEFADDIEQDKPQMEEQVDITPQEVVDLDVLYQEKTLQKEAETDDLAELLNEFTFDEEPEVSEETPFNEELYQEIINNNNIQFSKSDIDRINQLMQLEITPETIDNLNQYIKAVASKPKKQTKSQILNNLLTTYSISQNISFSKEDVEAMKKIMNVELDSSFITDLSTNPARVKEVEEELAKQHTKPHKTSEVLTLNVKNLLPNLSQELEKQGNKPIVSEVKNDVVYYSEGYEVSKLSVSEELNNISTALQSKDDNEYRPSDFLPIVENGYEYSTLSIKNELPDLEDVKAHPEKYAEKKQEKVEVDENALLNSISNVTFKPFYTDVQEESNQFEEFEIINSESEQNIAEQSHKQASYTKEDRVNDDAARLLKLIETQQTQRALKKHALEEAREFKKELQKASKRNEEVKDSPQIIFEFEGQKYILLKTSSCGDSAECNLTQSEDGYNIFGYINGKRSILKHYDSLKTTNMQLRESEKDNNGNVQYLVRIGNHKFIIKITDDNMEFVMDLC